MYDKDFAELVKIAAEKLKEDTVYKMLTRSEDYQKESDERDKAERNYEQLDLTMEQRKVCDVFLDYRDRQSLPQKAQWIRQVPKYENISPREPSF